LSKSVPVSCGGAGCIKWRFVGVSKRREGGKTRKLEIGLGLGLGRELVTL